MTIRTRRRLAGLLVVAAVTACSGGSDGSVAGGATEDEAATSTTTTAVPVPAEPVDDRSWPDPDWEAVDPAEAGLDAAALEQMAATAERAGSECLVVTKDGALVGEWTGTASMRRPSARCSR